MKEKGMEKDIILQYEEAAAKLFELTKKWKDTWESWPKWLARLQRIRIGKKAWKIFKFFVDSKVENEAALAVNFFTNIKGDFFLLDMLDSGYKSAVKNGTEPILETSLLGQDGVQSIFDFIFYRWPVLSEID